MMEGEKNCFDGVGKDALYQGSEEGVSNCWTGIWNGMAQWKLE